MTLEELLKQSEIDWHRVGHEYKKHEKKDEIFAAIVRMNPNLDDFEAILQEWYRHEGEKNWDEAYSACTESFVDSKLLDRYLEAIKNKTAASGSTYRNWLQKLCKDLPTVATDLIAAKLQCTLAFLTFHKWEGSDCVDSCVCNLLNGRALQVGVSNTIDASAWKMNDHRNWKRLQTIVLGACDSQKLPFLEAYLMVIQRSGFASCSFEDRLVHLQLVGKYAPELFLERNENAGNTFLNHILTHIPNRSIWRMCLVAGAVEQCIEAVTIPNNAGKTPLRLLLCGLAKHRQDYRKICEDIATRRPEYLTSTSHAADGQEEQAPFFMFVSSMVALLAKQIKARERPHRHNKLLAVLRHAVLDQEGAGCNKNPLDRNGNTALHLAILSYNDNSILLTSCKWAPLRALLNLFTNEQAL